jgi:hypothetical protein
LRRPRAELTAQELSDRQHVQARWQATALRQALLDELARGRVRMVGGRYVIEPARFPPDVLRALARLAPKD